MWTSILSVVVIINELMASNAGVTISPATNFDSWIELYNPTEQSVSLAGMYLSDDEADLKRWQMPSNMGTIPAKGFKVVWLGSGELKSTQAPFKLDCDGGTIYLSDKNGALVARQTYPKALSRTAYARTTDGGEEWGWTADATPGRSNASAKFAAQRLDAPVVSKASTLFKNSVSVKVAIPEGTTLMYTTDGSLPLMNANGQESKDGKFTFNKTTNLTLRLFREGYLPSTPVTRSYIKTSKNYSLPVISIVGDQKFFTDPKIGFDCDGDGTNGTVASYTGGQARNYASDWDRPVNFSYISPEGEMLYNQDVNIKVSGGYTRTQKYRSFKLKASKVFDGQNRYDYPFFPQKPYMRSKTLLVRNGGNDIWRHNARFIDPALETIVQRSGIDVDVQSYVPVIEYVNGQLRGVLNLREPNNADFAYANWGYDDEELDAFENMEMKDGDDVAINRILELAKDINADGAYEELTSLLDIDEYTNYMAVTLFLYNDDWPDNNIKAYRSRNDGRYRFVSFDLDYAFKGCWGSAAENPSDDNPFKNFAKFKDDNGPKRNGHSVVYNKEFVNLFLDLLSHDGYRRKFIDTFCLMGGSVFEPTRAAKITDELLNNVKSMCQLMKQQGINDGHDPDRAASTIKSNLSGRSKLMANYLKAFSYAKLKSSAQTVKLTTDTEGARLFINDIEVPYSDFDGHLFAPVTLRAEAPAGYRFAGWKKGSSILSTEAEMNLPSGSVGLTATFTKLSDSELAAQSIAPVRINEVSAADGIYVNDYFKRKDWVELYNTTDKDIDAEGMYLSDNPEKPEKYQITKGDSQASTIIPAHGYLIVWCDKESPLAQLHASFKLDNDGDELLLTAADKSWTDHFTYAAHQSDQTVGRYPDGSNDIYVMNRPTIAQSNLATSYFIPVEQPDRTGIDIAQLSILNSKFSIYNLAGQPVVTPQRGNCYIARITDAQGHVKTVKFIQK